MKAPALKRNALQVVQMVCVLKGFVAKQAAAGPSSAAADRILPKNSADFFARNQSPMWATAMHRRPRHYSAHPLAVHQNLTVLGHFQHGFKAVVASGPGDEPHAEPGHVRLIRADEPQIAQPVDQRIGP